MRTTLLFDLDGTLTDPRVGLLGCVKYSLERLSQPCPADDVLLGFIGPPLRQMFASLLTGANPELVERAVDYYRERYTDIGVYETHLYDGVPSMLADCTKANCTSFVATSKPTVFAERIVQHLDLDRHFAGVYGPALDGRFDDKADLLRHLLLQERITPNDAIMVGDRAADVIAAKKNDVRCIGVLWGYGSLRELNDAGADTVCATPGELSSSLSRLHDIQRL